jgi:hypothetical protein
MTRTKLTIAVIIMAIIDVLLLVMFAGIGETAERFQFHPLCGDSVTVLWHAGTEPDLKEYRLYYIGPGNDGRKVIAAPDTSLRLRVGLGYFWERVAFRVTAVDYSGNESAPSDTISTIMCKEWRLVGDIDGNGRVNVIDKAWYWISAGTKRGDLLYAQRCDFDGNGAVNVIDKSYMALNAGASK